MSDLTEFLLARIEEDEAAATLVSTRPAKWTMTIYPPIGGDDSPIGSGPFDPARILAECEAKRHLLDEALVWGEGCLDVIARYMAEVYADHPAYDEAWRP